MKLISRHFLDVIFAVNAPWKRKIIVKTAIDANRNILDRLRSIFIYIWTGFADQNLL